MIVLRFVWLLVLALLVPLRAAVALPAVVRAAPAVAQLNIQTTDLPKAALKFMDGTVTPAGLAKISGVPAAAFVKRGIILQNTREFLVKKTWYVLGVVTLLSSAAKAKAEFALTVPEYMKDIQPGATPVFLGRLGGEHTAVVGITVEGGDRIPVSFAEVQEGRYLFTCQLIGAPKSISSQETIKLAKAVDARMKWMRG